MYNFRINREATKILSSFIQLMLLFSGIEVSPGPGTYPFRHCNKLVRYGRSIACDSCDINGTIKSVLK